MLIIIINYNYCINTTLTFVAWLNDSRGISLNLNIDRTTSNNK